MRPSRPLLLAGLFLLAFGVRFAYTRHSSQGAGELVYDAIGYDSYATHLLQERRYEGPDGKRAGRLPGYPIFLAGVYGVLGRSVESVQLVQCVLSSLACVLIALFASALLSPPWGLAAGLLSVFYYDFFTGVPRILSETLYIFLISAFLFAWSRRGGFPAAYMAALGLLMGLAAMVRPEAALVAGALALLVFGRPSRKSFLAAALFSAGFALALAPWTVRNHRVLGRWLPSSSVGGYNGWLGLSMSLEKAGYPAQRFEPPAGSELEVDAAYGKEGKALYRRTPLKAILKVVAFNAAVLFYPFHPGYDATLVFCLPFWLLGLAWAARNPEGRVLAVFLAVSGVVYIFFGSTVSRYREPLAPAVVVLAAAGAAGLAERVSLRRLGTWAGAWAALNLLVWLLAPQLRALALRGKAALW